MDSFACILWISLVSLRSSLANENKGCWWLSVLSWFACSHRFQWFRHDAVTWVSWFSDWTQCAHVESETAWWLIIQIGGWFHYWMACMRLNSMESTGIRIQWLFLIIIRPHYHLIPWNMMPLLMLASCFIIHMGGWLTESSWYAGWIIAYGY